jgi:hypothetical protein
MSCSEAVDHARWLRRKLMEQQIALEGTLFYANSLEWNARTVSPY